MPTIGFEKALKGETNNRGGDLIKEEKPNVGEEKSLTENFSKVELLNEEF